MPRYVVHCRGPVSGDVLPPVILEASNGTEAADKVAQAGLRITRVEEYTPEMSSPSTDVQAADRVGPVVLSVMARVEDSSPPGALGLAPEPPADALLTRHWLWPLVILWLALTVLGGFAFNLVRTEIEYWSEVGHWNNVINTERANPETMESQWRIQMAAMRLDWLSKTRPGRFAARLPMSLVWTGLLNLAALAVAAWERQARWLGAYLRTTLLMFVLGVALGELCVWLGSFTNGLDVAAVVVGVVLGWLWLTLLRKWTFARRLQDAELPD